MSTALDAVYEANARRLQETRSAQTQQPQWMKDYSGGLSSQRSAPMNTAYSQPWSTAPGSKSFLSMTSDGSRPDQYDTQSGIARGQTTGSVLQQSQQRTDPNSGKKAAMGFWEEQRQAWSKANEDTLVDRGAMLQELADFKAQSVLSNEKMAQTLSDTEEKLRANTTEIMDRVRNNFASMGRSASPYMMAELSKRLALQNQDKVNTVRSQLELDRAQVHGAYIDRLYEVLGNTRRQTLDPQMALAMMKMMGEGDAGEGAVSFNGGGMKTGGGRAKGRTIPKMGDGKGTTTSRNFADGPRDLTGGLVNAGQHRPGTNPVKKQTVLIPSDFKETI
ncbi:MAG TPA: hypothetical protein DCZ94_21510 [Lentisphaeria bacterium]|nr:MAG: hypothetical protein A2X48_14440 [Lentisphaerae bacterium GWF2_49_21]HBC89523.1 hypothetical protein [Lentisphaeria bacterium]